MITKAVALIAHINGEWYIATDEWTIDNVIAWAHLPKPYKGGYMSWTLCRHQMPENNVNVLFCRVDGEIFVGHHFHLDNYWVTMGYAIPDNDVKAWMPLPEPYKAGSEVTE